MHNETGTIPLGETLLPWVTLQPIMRHPVGQLAKVNTGMADGVYIELKHSEGRAIQKPQRD